MPYINFHNVDELLVTKFKTECLEEFGKISSADLKHIHIINHMSTIVGEDDFSFIKVEWMPRSSEQQELIKNLINKFLFENNFSRSAIYFVDLERSNYYTEDKK